MSESVIIYKNKKPAKLKKSSGENRDINVCKFCHRDFCDKLSNRGGQSLIQSKSETFQGPLWNLYLITCRQFQF